VSLVPAADIISQKLIIKNLKFPFLLLFIVVFCVFLISFLFSTLFSFFSDHFPDHNGCETDSLVVIYI
jgi:hypothetical protein